MTRHPHPTPSVSSQPKPPQSPSRSSALLPQVTLSPWHQSAASLQDLQLYQQILHLQELLSDCEQALAPSPPSVQEATLFASQPQEGFDVQQPPAVMLQALLAQLWQQELALVTPLCLQPSASWELLFRLAHDSGQRWSANAWGLHSASSSSSAANLREWAMILSNSVLLGFPRSPNLLVRRALERTLEVELLHCPHQAFRSTRALHHPQHRQQHQQAPTPSAQHPLHNPAVLPQAADLLCQFHTHWVEGLMTTSLPEVQVTHSQARGPDRCVLSASLTHKLHH